MKLNKKGMAKFSYNTIEVYILAFVFLVVLFEIIADLFPTLTAAGDTLNSSGFPLAELFATDGAAYYIIAVGLIVLFFLYFSPKRKHTK